MTEDYPRADNDAERVAFLSDLAVLDTAPDASLDRITELCRDVFGVPVAVVTLVSDERQWFKSVQGLDVCETSRDVAFCNYTILSEAIFEVVDAVADPRFAVNPLVVGDPSIRYYAGAPLVYDGMRLGALCLIDFVAREPLDERHRRILHALAAMVVRELRLQRVLRSALASLASSPLSHDPTA
jgi:GAF domain-containing protein